MGDSPASMRFEGCRVALLVGLVIVAGCSDTARVEPAAGSPELVAGVIPVREGVTHGTGTELGHGFEVADGSVLVGGVMRRLYSYAGDDDLVPDDGWTAVLLVTEPGRVVFDRYLAQAEAAGFPDLSPPFVGAPLCTGDGEELACTARAGEGTDGHHRSVSLNLVQEGGSGTTPPQTNLVIEYSQVGAPPYEPWAAGSVPPESDGVGGVPSNGWPPLPEVGDEFWTARTVSPPFAVAEGSSVLVHSTRYEDVGSLTLFEVTGDAEDVIRSYFTQWDEDEPNIIRWERDDATVRTMSWADGSGYYLRVYQERGQPAWMLLEVWPSD